MHYYFPFSQYIDIARALSEEKPGMEKRETELFLTWGFFLGQSRGL